MSAMVICVFILAFCIAYSIGANDAANALATSYGSGALKPTIYLLMLGCVCEFVGAYFCSGRVAGTLVNSVIGNATNTALEVTNGDALIVEGMMLSTSIASFAFIIVSVVFAMPISGTHTVIGGLIGAGIVGVGADQVNWPKLGTIVLSWVISPMLSCAISFCLIMVVCGLTLNKNISANWKLIWL